MQHIINFFHNYNLFFRNNRILIVIAHQSQTEPKVSVNIFLLILIKVDWKTE